MPPSFTFESLLEYFKDHPVKVLVAVASAVLISKFLANTAKASKKTKPSVPASQPSTSPAATVTKKTEPPAAPLVYDKNAALSPEEYRHFRLREKIIVSHNTRIFRFDLQTPETVLGLPIGKHIMLSATIDGKEISRAYTPISSNDDLGKVDFMIKVYPQGAMSKYVDGLNIGDTLAMKGPRGRFEYKKGMKRAFGMLAGGTGITPMLQVAKAVLKDSTDPTEFSLIFANVSADDILLKSDIDEMTAKHPNFKAYYVLNEAPEGWTGGVGFISEQMIRERLPAPADDVMVLICGPLPMVKAMTAHCDAIGYPKEAVFKF